ncbi:DUF3093 domain-containing protein [Gulosibacter macacae]|uniref:DUF3093 domain-containing protein n=1 Tax=Gulosibacter macacae TaxID=2488791 RepID=A0A3P3W1H5_9MICO|nr:DUF3093 domain-containing protein [Gulosibacter macacae]
MNCTSDLSEHPGTPRENVRVTYRERVTPGWLTFLAAAMIVPAVIVVFLPINPIVGIILAIVSFAGLCLFLYNGSPIIEVDAKTLRVGSARVPLRDLGELEAFTDRAAAREQAGPKLDARAWTCLRGWAPQSARVEITDEHDPIPYWLFSTRDPEAVVAAIRSAKARLNS